MVPALEYLVQVLVSRTECLGAHRKTKPMPKGWQQIKGLVGGFGCNPACLDNSKRCYLSGGCFPCSAASKLVGLHGHSGVVCFLFKSQLASLPQPRGLSSLLKADTCATAQLDNRAFERCKHLVLPCAAIRDLPLRISKFLSRPGGAP